MGKDQQRGEDEPPQQHRQRFLERLQEFPNLFQIMDRIELTPNRIRNLLNRLNTERADDSHFRTPSENTCISNLIAFLLLLENDATRAMKETAEILHSENNGTSIVPLAHMAVMQWEAGDKAEAERLVTRLQELRGQANFRDMLLDAKANMGYCYSRMGTKSASLAVEIFEEVVRERPRDYTWMYGLANVLRRFTHLNYKSFHGLTSESTSQRSLRAFYLLLEIRDSDAHEIQRGRALSELGILLEQSSWLPELDKVKRKAEEMKITAEQCFEGAVSLAPTDVHVLTYSGKYFKNANQLERSRMLLERAISIRPTTTAHQYLGNTFIKMAKSEQRRSSKRSKRFSGRSYSSRGGTQNRGASAQMSRVKKSPRLPPPLKRDKRYVADALENFQRAVELAQGDNPSAVYDLGLLLASLGEDDESLKQFSTIIEQPEALCTPQILINAHEQAGLINMRKCSNTRNERDRQRYGAEGRRLLRDASQMQGSKRLNNIQDADLQKDRENFLKRLEKFPNLFQIKDLSELTSSRRKKLLHELKSKKCDKDYHHAPAKDTCMSNFIAFLLFLENGADTAMEETKNVLTNDTSVVALAHMAVMNWETGNREEAERFVTRLQELHGQADFKSKVLDGKAEMAYCYSRMGSNSAFLLAVEIFEEVVRKRPQDYTWKYNLALVLRKLTQDKCEPSKVMRKNSLRAFDLFLEITESDAPDIQRARAWSELGMFLEPSQPSLRNKHIRDVEERARQKGVKAQQCLIKARELAPKDVHVLTCYGKFFEKKDKLEKSLQALEVAISIRPTATAHEYLGYVFMKMAKINQKGQPRLLSAGRTRGGNRASGGRRKESVKSSAKQPPPLLWDDNVKAALHHFQMAIDISHGDNQAAVCELEKICSSLGEDYKALT